MAKKYRSEVFYNPEDDLHYHHAHSQTNAQILPQNENSRKEGESRGDFVSEFLRAVSKVFWIEHTMKTKVDNEFVRGVSGGEKKRVSIAEAMITKASVQSWDNNRIPRSPDQFGEIFMKSKRQADRFDRSIRVWKKTMLLNTMAQLTRLGFVQDAFLVDGRPLISCFQRSTGIAEQDVHESTATIREELRFSAKLRQPKEVPLQEKYNYAEGIIDLLEMREIAGAAVGKVGSGLNQERRE
ncbi:hypothetical protein K432DRAFT_430663 [Lepidopterella palustris CBS 459.81]|uniref:ABC transporter domain-containing protein n=1 Tax=Lepidopterella palustris CBS 459.81 TaxID=1314670 RepID=A0A8E2DX84_9PEZI|nr:hypothetical protein K432DRAFT_430663 [Lepidopterella palustris CBS 459.81]